MPSNDTTESNSSSTPSAVGQRATADPLWPPELKRSPLTDFLELLWRHGINVIPLPRGEKIPRVKWKPFQERRMNVAELHKLFLWRESYSRNGKIYRRTARLRGVSYAIITGGTTRVVVVDTDSPEAEEWAQKHLPPTPWMTKTRKGWHRFYLHPGGGTRIGNKARIQTGDSKIALDVRGDGGYVVGPYSVHETGFVYQSVGDWAAPIDSLPLFDLSWLPALPPRNPAPQVYSLPPAHPSIQSDFERAQAYVDRMGPAVEGDGGRNHTFKVAMALLRFGLSLDDCMAILRRWNQSCVPPWDECGRTNSLEERLQGAMERWDGVTDLRDAQRKWQGHATEDNLTPEALECLINLCEQAEEAQREREREALSTGGRKMPWWYDLPPGSPAVHPPPPVDTVYAFDWPTSPILTGEPYENLCDDLKSWRIEPNGCDAYWPARCHRWLCCLCGTEKATEILEHMKAILQEGDEAIYKGAAPAESAAYERIKKAISRSLKTEDPIGYFPFRRAVDIDGFRFIQITYYASHDIGPGWERITREEAFIEIRSSLALPLPQPTRDVDDNKGERTRPLGAWTMPEKKKKREPSPGHIGCLHPDAIARARVMAQDEIFRKHGTRFFTGEPIPPEHMDEYIDLCKWFGRSPKWQAGYYPR